MSSVSSSNDDIQNAEHFDDRNEETKSDDPDPSISFIEQVEIALARAKSEKKILMVLCEAAQNVQYIDIWNNPKIVESVQTNAICLLIRDDTLAFEQFTTLYPVVAFPTMYCINPQNGQVLQCKYKEQITVDSVIVSINTSIQLIIKHENEAKGRREIQIREITEQKTSQHNQIISIQEMDQRSEDSLISLSPPFKPKKKKSALTKLEQIREKARSQKKQPPTNAPPTAIKSNKKANKKKLSKSVGSTPTKHSSLNNYNFDGDKLDAIEYMEITRRNKLRKRKKKVEAKLNIKQKKPVLSVKKTNDHTKDEDIVSTPILSAVKKGRIDGVNMSKKRARLAFRINNEIDIFKYFNYDDKLIDVMMYIMNETGMNDFVFVSQYPPIDIDSIYLDRKMSAQIGLFSGNDDEKSNESMYDEIQNKLQKTLYELSMVPSCRVFIQPKFKGYPRGDNDRNNNIILRIMKFIIDLIKIIAQYGYNGLFFVCCLLWEIINIPLKMIGITKENTQRDEIHVKKSINDNKRKSKLRPLKKNNRLTGKKSNIQRLLHLEKDEDKNRLNNGNSTMYGGDGKQ